MADIGILPQKKNPVKNIFGKEKAIIGMIHTKALPGAPRYNGESMEEIIEFSINDAKALKAGGVDGLMFENAWDVPFSKPEDIGYETVAALTVLANEVTKEVDLPFGFNFLANGVIQSLAAAKATNADWVRCNQWVNAYVANEGILEGASAEAMRYKKMLHGEDIRVLADVHVKHGSHSIVADRSLAEQTRDNIFFDADILIATGSRTGDETSLDELIGISNNTQLPVIVGSGLNDNNAKKILEIASGAVVGSYLKEDGVWWNPVDVERVKRLMEIVNKLR
ncbi:BtpA protein [Halanaerobium saccharolyticum subsp. saccharolyticum DSM 6643]|uniref:BtpA protein n=1 Tax=Halanaerobium saccharolyticum subsp. saccharolyticum DSM 6643 TaxID=1293054 RepID=M5EC64_9FIRM|nr:BtpA/SgcQ family protein [Halanaerobium saccharolyticum]CCU78453.1 BtpA protein [Halanaerobium saccharolyticum subsp. saccharolyticum DSM 6643]